MKQHIYLSLANMGGAEQKFVQNAFDTNWVVPMGPNVDGFEAAKCIYRPYYGSGISDTLFHQGLCLPSGSQLSESDLARVCDTIKNIL